MLCSNNVSSILHSFRDITTLAVSAFDLEKSCRIVPFLMTLSDLYGLSPVASLFNCHLYTVVQQITRFQLIWRVARSLGDN